MKDYCIKNLRNIGLIGHNGTGKTSLAESILYYSKITDRIGKIEEGNTVLDYDPEEKKRQFSISLSIAPVELDNVKINIIDIPGYADFHGECIQGMRAVDVGMIVVSGVSGIKAGIASVFKSVVNSLIGGINKVVAIPFDKINGMLNNIRAVKIMKWKPFEKMWGHNPLPVPQIPKMGGVPALAEGAVLKPNAPFLAMVGDQKHGTNIESPLSTIVDAFRQVQGENATGISDKDLLNAISNMQVNVIVQQDSRGVFNMVKQEVVQEQRRTGKPVWI